MLTSPIDNYNNHFTVPTTEKYIQDEFGIDAAQVKSGESVVVLDNTMAYKYTLSNEATMRRLNLYYYPPEFY